MSTTGRRFGTTVARACSTFIVTCFVGLACGVEEDHVDASGAARVGEASADGEREAARGEGASRADAIGEDAVPAPDRSMPSQEARTDGGVDASTDGPDDPSAGEKNDVAATLPEASNGPLDESIVAPDAADVDSYVDGPSLDAPTSDRTAVEGAPEAGGCSIIANDGRGTVIVSPTVLATTESGSTATATVVLASQPSTDVRVPLFSARPAVARLDSPELLTFTPSNWNVPQTITVSGVDNAHCDGNHLDTIVTGPTSSTDFRYDNIDPEDLSVVNFDNESGGVFLSASPTPLVTSESGGHATFTIALTCEPRSNVLIPLASDTSSEGTVAPGLITFTPHDWSAPRTVTVTGVADNVTDPAHPFRVTVGPALSLDSTFDGLSSAGVALVNDDDGVDAAGSMTANAGAGVIVDQAGPLIATEGGAPATFAVRLRSQPTSNVTFDLSAGEPDTVAPSTLVFTSVDWNAPHTVTVTAPNDDVAGGDELIAVTGTATSLDTHYRGLHLPNIVVRHVDDDAAGIVAVPSTGLSTTEAGGTATFDVRLHSRPTANVTLALWSSNPAEGRVAPTRLVFSPTTWDLAQAVTVMGVDDCAKDGDRAYSVVLSPGLSEDATYESMPTTSVEVTNRDDD